MIQLRGGFNSFEKGFNTFGVALEPSLAQRHLGKVFENRASFGFLLAMGEEQRSAGAMRAEAIGVNHEKEMLAAELNLLQRQADKNAKSVMIGMNIEDRGS